MSPTSVLALALVVCLQDPTPAESPAEHSERAATVDDADPIERRIELGNGIVAILRTYPESEFVALQAIYSVGSVHSPARMTQAAHLVERLVASGPTKSFGRAEAATYLSEVGRGNAETFPDSTRFEYVVPAIELERALVIEAERLTGTKLDTKGIALEASRCDAETDAAEKSTAAGMPKHAVMALAQLWRHGIVEASVRGGLEEFELDRLAAFHSSTYRPDALTLVLAGGFELDRAEELVRKHFGSVARVTSARPRAIDWTKLPSASRVTWDAAPRVICVGWRPPSDARERLLLSWFGPALRQRLSVEPSLRGLIDNVYSSTHLWPVGELPFFVIVQLKPDADLALVEALVIARVDAWLAAGANRAYHRQIAAGAENLFDRATPDWAVLEDDITYSAKHSEWEREELATSLLALVAFERAVCERLFGSDPARVVAELLELERDDVNDLMKRCLNSEQRFVVRLVPAE